MMIKRHYLAMIAVALMATSCAPLGSAPAGGQSTSPAAPSTDPKALGVALQGEPQVLITSLGLGNQPNLGGDVQGAMHQKLATLDDRGELHAQLAALPSQDNGDWVVRPDGTMQTTYRLRNDVTWHDGTPLTAKDFIFAHTVTTDPELPVSQGKVAIYIDGLDAPDDHTLVVQWSKTYPFANGIVEDDLGPLPGHLIEEVYRTDKERFQQLPFWTTGFVGVGPYQMDEWVLGSHMTVKAYDRFYAGRAKIDTITFRFVENAPTVVANLIAGALDGAIPAAMDFQQSFLVKTEWDILG
ncbi:MAG: hypothetical protein GEU73_01195 [Chloroflexi bacterium]|nr:hypothetical protein [Chloroflexota bacterium]